MSYEPAPYPSRGNPSPVTQPRRRRPGCAGITCGIILWTLFWAGVALAVATLPRVTPPWAYIAVGVGALLTLVLWTWRVTRFGRAARRAAKGGKP